MEVVEAELVPEARVVETDVRCMCLLILVPVLGGKACLCNDHG